MATFLLHHPITDMNFKGMTWNTQNLVNSLGIGLHVTHFKLIFDPIAVHKIGIKFALLMCHHVQTSMSVWRTMANALMPVQTLLDHSCVVAKQDMS